MQFSTLKETLDYNSNFEDIIEESLEKNIIGLDPLDYKDYEWVSIEGSYLIPINNNTILPNIFTDLVESDTTVLDNKLKYYTFPDNLLEHAFSYTALSESDTYFLENWVKTNGGENMLGLSIGEASIFKLTKNSISYNKLDANISYNVYAYNKFSNLSILSNNTAANTIDNMILVGNGTKPSDFTDLYLTTELETKKDIPIDILYSKVGLPAFVSGYDYNASIVDTTTKDLIKSLFVRKSTTQQSLGKLKQLVNTDNTKIAQIAKNFKRDDLIFLINFFSGIIPWDNAKPSFSLTNLIFVPIRTEVDEEKLEELLTKEIIKTKLLEKLT